MRKSGFVEDGRKEWARRRHLMESYAWCFRGLGIIVPLSLLLPSSCIHHHHHDHHHLLHLHLSRHYSPFPLLFLSR